MFIASCFHENKINSSPETSDAVNVNIALHVIVLVINPKMFLIAEMSNRIVRAKTIGVKGRIKTDTTFDNCPQSLGFYIFNNLGITFPFLL
jgi:hypothetical protein